LSLFAAVQWLTSDIQISSRWIAVVMSLRWHCRRSSDTRWTKDSAKSQRLSDYRQTVLTKADVPERTETQLVSGNASLPGPVYCFTTPRLICDRLILYAVYKCYYLLTYLFTYLLTYWNCSRLHPPLPLIIITELENTVKTIFSIFPISATMYIGE